MIHLTHQAWWKLWLEINAVATIQEQGRIIFTYDHMVNFCTP